MSTADTVQLEVATPLGLALSVQAHSVQAPSVEGEFGVLSKHVPMLVALKAGVLTYIVDGKKSFAAVGSGFAEVGPSKMIVLADFFKRAEDIDLTAAENDYVAASEKLRSIKDEVTNPAYIEAERKVQWAQARLHAYQNSQAI